MQTNLSFSDLQLIWIIGATERLVSLGILSPDLPLNLKPESQNVFMELDREEILEKLFHSNKELFMIFSIMVKSECPNTPDKNIEDIGNVLIQYKNDRIKLLKHAFEHQYAKV